MSKLWPASQLWPSTYFNVACLEKHILFGLLQDVSSNKMTWQVVQSVRWNRRLSERRYMQRSPNHLWNKKETKSGLFVLCNKLELTNPATINWLSVVHFFKIIISCHNNMQVHRCSGHLRYYSENKIKNSMANRATITFLSTYIKSLDFNYGILVVKRR